ncbi:MAG: hypothetical protein V2B20_28515 [Pseudomonadota bacterium]
MDNRPSVKIVADNVASQQNVQPFLESQGFPDGACKVYSTCLYHFNLLDKNRSERSPTCQKIVIAMELANKVISI